MPKRDFWVVLDLDSTVICSLRPDVPQPRGLVGYNMDDEYIVYERPGLQDFLDFLFANFHVGVWTAASKDYGIFIVENVLLQNRPEREVEFFLFDYHGDLSEQIPGGCPKNLRMLWDTLEGPTPENTVIIDDYEEVYLTQICNAYPIHPFKADHPKATQDRELEILREKLKHVQKCRVPTDDLISEKRFHKYIESRV